MTEYPPVKSSPRLARFILFMFLGLLVGALVGVKALQGKVNKSVIINGLEIFIETVATPESIAGGLSGRDFLLPNTGMFFLLGKSEIHSFWMKDMKFNLDFVFINDNKVVDIRENVPFPKSGEVPINVISKEKFDKVLEINAGEIKRIGIEIGQELRIMN